MNQFLMNCASCVAKEHFGNKIYIRGLIEISSYCKNDCYYCGLRCSNGQARRYRLSKEEILACCKVGYAIGFRTFVLQGGEDPYFTDQVLVDVVSAIRKEYPDCAITLSLGERSRASYQALYEAGANRYLLRHETADSTHYGRLHPAEMSLEHRMECLWQLKDIGYQVGTGIMVGSPGQTVDTIQKDLAFMRKLNPQMIGIGPFIPHKDTPFGTSLPGTVDQTVELISILRLMFPKALIPATTALATLKEDGREKGILAGANVVMPNLSPPKVREQYLLYDNKAYTGVESAEGLKELEARLEQIGYQITKDRGDYSV